MKVRVRVRVRIRARVKVRVKVRVNVRVRVRVRDTAPVARGVRQALQAVALLAGDLAKLRLG